MQRVITCNVTLALLDWFMLPRPGTPSLHMEPLTAAWRTKKTTKLNRSMRHSVKTLTAGSRLEHHSFQKENPLNQFFSWLGKFQPFVFGRNFPMRNFTKQPPTFQMLTPTRRAGKCAIELGQPVSWSAAKTDDSLAQNNRKHVVVVAQKK